MYLGGRVLLHLAELELESRLLGLLGLVGVGVRLGGGIGLDVGTIAALLFMHAAKLVHISHVELTLGHGLENLRGLAVRVHHALDRVHIEAATGGGRGWESR